MILDDEALSQRIIALVRLLGGEMKAGAHYVSQIEPMREEARSIVALLEPVDADLIEARKMESEAAEVNGFTEYASRVRMGEKDDEEPVRCRYEGIKRGRVLSLKEYTEQTFTISRITKEMEV